MIDFGGRAGSRKDSDATQRLGGKATKENTMGGTPGLLAANNQGSRLDRGLKNQTELGSIS